ncbi:MAG: hypothetical protein KJI70_03320, partial [Patescibacteria group bacterium]|nr:hypothetical protein [Patescibacteria group bacterium]
ILGLIIIGVIFFTQYEKIFNFLQYGQLDKPVLTEEDVKEIRYEATETGDIALCKKLQDQDKDYCEYVVINAEAGRKQDPSICDALQDERRRNVCKDNAIITKAMNEQDVSYCENIIDEERVDYCKEQVSALIL